MRHPGGTILCTLQAPDNANPGSLFGNENAAGGRGAYAPQAGSNVMNNHHRLSFVFLVTLAAAACSSNANNPSQPSGPTASITAPVTVGPTDNARFRHADQPVTLAVQNVTVTTAGTTTYTFEVATDSAFSTKVQTKDNVPEGTGGQTSVKLDPLPPGKDYFWHARAQRAGTVGVFGTTYAFNIGPGIIIDAPVAVSPLTGGQATVNRPTFTAMNAVRQGPAATLVYMFEIASNPGFSPVAIAGTMTEGPGQTSFTPTTELVPSTTHYWRVTAVDQANSISSAPSTTQSFNSALKSPQGELAAQLGVSLWPGVQPTGSTGRAVLGDNWHVQTLYHAPTRTTFVSPTIEELRLFDLMDRGMGPQGAIDWLHANGYPTTAQYYPSVDVIGIPYEYIARINGRWDLVLRAE
jgi:hypothetical protein